MPSYIYKFINYEGDIIYIGKTDNLKQRMKQHFGPYPHLPKECYEQVEKVFFANVASKYNAELLETYFINEYHPIYNKDKKYKPEVSNIKIDMIEPDWQELLFLKIKTKNGLNGIEFLKNNPPYIDRTLFYMEAWNVAFKYNFIKLECYEYEFKHLCPTIYSLLGGNLKEIKALYEYAYSHFNRDESSIDEVFCADVNEQFEYNHIAFNLGSIKELSKTIPDFNLMLKCGLVQNMAKDIFKVNFLTANFLRKIEREFLQRN